MRYGITTRYESAELGLIGLINMNMPTMNLQILFIRQFPGGHRYNLGVFEERNTNFDLAQKHFMIKQDCNKGHDHARTVSVDEVKRVISLLQEDESLLQSRQFKVGLMSQLTTHTII